MFMVPLKRILISGHLSPSLTMGPGWLLVSHIQNVIKTRITYARGVSMSSSYAPVPGCRWAATSSETQHSLTELEWQSRYQEMECAWLLDRLNTPQEVAPGRVAIAGQDA